MLKKIDTKKAPAAIGPYSQAIVCGNMLFTSGQIPIDPATGDIHGADITGAGRAGHEEPRRRPRRSRYHV